jgi:ATP-dependent Lon protease
LALQELVKVRSDHFLTFDTPCLQITLITASIAESIARALGRQHFRISGAMSDPAELKGHRRTYLGAVPGKVVYGMKKVQVSNPVITIDEIDKIGSYSHRGDPSAVLLELLDPEQNNSFSDHYLDLPLDCSRAIFICTANTTDTISPPLLDRMQVIRLSGYVVDEKMAILQQHILPRIRRDTGVGDMVKISEAAQRTLVEQYSREAGVRSLMKSAERIHRKAALRLLQSHQQQEADAAAATVVADATAAPASAPAPEAPAAPIKPYHKPISVTEKNLRDFVGQPPHTDDQPYEGGITPVGVVTGLAWTQLGGSTLTIETVLDAFDKAPVPTLTLTGYLEEVMRESSKIAHTFAKQFMVLRFPTNKTLDTSSIHLHVPSGAVKKDGPSAGVTIVTALLSLALNRPVRPKLAMTGEISLTGRVIRIGGVREKTMAAKQFGCDTVVLPLENKSDFEKLPAYIKSGLTVHYARDYEDVFRVAFGDGLLASKSSSTLSPEQPAVSPTKPLSTNAPSQPRMS